MATTAAARKQGMTTTPIPVGRSIPTGGEFAPFLTAPLVRCCPDRQSCGRLGLPLRWSWLRSGQEAEEI